MTHVMHFCLGLIILIASSFNSVDADYKKYISLITSVRDHYRTSSVFFIFSRNNQRMEEYTMVHLLTRIFSNSGASTLISVFPSLNSRLNSYKNRMGPPLIVVMLRSYADIVEFGNSVETINKSYAIWLVIFSGFARESLCDYCTNPIGNMFDLRFDTLMFVVCCDDSIIQQWWSVHENQTAFHNFMRYTENEDFELLEVRKLRAKRHNVFGTELRLVIVSDSSMIRDHGDNRIEGFLGEVLSELQIAMNFTIKSMSRSEIYGSYNSTSKSWSGAIDLLARDVVDIGLADFTITEPRLDVVDFTLPLLISSFELYIKQPEQLDLQWAAYFEVFTLETWLAIIILLMTTPFLLAIIKVKKVSVSLLSVSMEKCLNVWGIFCQQGLLEFPAETPLRMAYFSIFVSSIIVFAAYSAALISFLTLSSTTMPFTSLEGFVADKSYQLIVTQQSAAYDFFSQSNAPIAVQMMELMKPLEDLPTSSSQAWLQVCEEKVAFYTSVLVKTMTPNIPCKVVGISTGRVESVAIALPAHSQYTDVVNYHIGRFKSNGMFVRIRNENNARNTVDQTINSFSSVEFSGIVPILSVLAGGIIVTFIVLFCEVIYCTVYKRKRCCSRKMKRRFIISREISSRQYKKRDNSRFY